MLVSLVAMHAGACPGSILDAKVKQRVQSTLTKKHQLQDVVDLTRKLLPEAATNGYDTCSCANTLPWHSLTFFNLCALQRDCVEEVPAPEARGASNKGHPQLPSEV